MEKTNCYARQKLAQSAARLAKWTDVNKQELKAYFGLCIIMGINTLPRIAMNWSSNRYIGNIGVQETMTKNRFKEISQYMHFSNSTQELQHGDDDYDCLFKVCSIINMVLSNFKRVYDPSKNMSINEGMIAYKGHLSFRQFMPGKPTKYGIKVWMAANAKNSYVSNFAVYLSQAENNRHRIHGLGYDVVMKMTEPFLNNYRHIFSTIFSQVRGFFITYACGTVRCNRKDLPPCAKHKLRFGEIARAQRSQLVFTKWHDKRDVAFLSINVSPDEPSRPVPRIHNRQNVNIEKPRVSDVYTAHMGGVDRADQLRSFYCSGWQSKKWYRYIFWFLFNVSVCNAFVLESEHIGSKRESVYFKLDLAQQLIDGFSQQKRKRRSNEVPPNHAVPQDQHVSVCIEGRKRKCVQCIESGRRTPNGYKVETRYECSICKVALCRTGCDNDFHSRS